MAKIGTLSADLTLESAAFIRDLNKAAEATNKNSSAMQRSMDATKAVFTAVAVAGAAAATALGVAVYNTLGTFDELGKTAQKIGIPVEELSKLKYAAQLSDVSMETLSASVGKLSKNMLDASQKGTGPAATAFKALSIQVENADGSLKSSSQVMTEIADRFAGMEDGAEKTARAMQIFGRSGADLIPMLNAGSIGLNKMFTEAEKLGIVIDTKTAKAAEEFNDNLTRLGTVWEGLITQISAAAAGPLATLTNRLTEIAIDGEAARKVGEAIGEMMETTAQAAETLWRNLDTLIVSYKAVVALHAIWKAGQFGPAHVAEATEALKNFAAALDGVTTSAQAADAALPVVKVKQLDDVLRDVGPPEEIQAVTESVEDLGGALGETASDAAASWAAQTRVLRTFHGEMMLVGDNMRTFFTEMDDNVQLTTGLLQTSFGSVQNTLSEFFQTTEFNFDKLLDGLKKGIADFMASKLVAGFGELLLNAVTGGTSGLLGGLLGGGGGGLLGGIVEGIGSIFGFAQGGSFRIPGASGSSDKPYLLGLGGGEHVNITPAGDEFRRGDESRSVVEIRGLNRKPRWTNDEVTEMIKDINERLRNGARLVVAG